MTLRKFLRVIIGLLLIIVVIAGLTLIYHPIVLKWLTGSARLIGRPTRAIVYTDGQVNKDILVFYINKYWNGEPADYYILYIPYAHNSRLKVFSLNRKDKYAGSPSATNIRDYDIVVGYLFQSEVGAHFTSIQDDIKGFNFDLQLAFTEGQIMLRIPPAAKELKCDSLRVVLQNSEP